MKKPGFTITESSETSSINSHKDQKSANVSLQDLDKEEMKETVRVQDMSSAYKSQEE